MNKHKTPMDWLEGRRRRAWELKQQGWKQQDIAMALGVTKGAVSQWLRRAREGGGEALRRQRAKGPTPKLTAEQLAQLPNLLAPGAEAYGYRGHVWTTKRVAEVIRRTFGVSYHPAHVSRLLRSVRLSVQAPIERATRARRASDCRLADRGVADAQKKAAEEERTIVWIDQSGFYLLPLAVRTYAPRGQTPILRVPLTRDHLAAISAITPDGRLVMQMQDHAYRSEDVVRFLRLLLRRIAGKLLVIWDGSPIHRGQAENRLLGARSG